MPSRGAQKGECAHCQRLGKCLSEHEAGQCHLFKMFFDFSPEPMFLGLLDGTILDANEAAGELLGLKKEALLKKNAQDLFPEDAMRKVFPASTQSLLTHGRSFFTFPHVLNKEGVSHTIEATARLVHQEGKPLVLVVFHDATHRVVLEEKTLQEKDVLASYLRIAGVLIMHLDPDGKITLINKRGNEILGYHNGDLIGKDWIDTCIAKEDRKQVRTVFQKCIKGEQTLVEHYDNYVITKTGEKRWISWHNAVIKDSDNKIIGILSSGEDITERIQLEEELRLSKEKYVSVVEHCHDGVVVLQDGLVKFFNQQMADMVGFSKDEAYGKPFIDFISDTYKKKTLAMHQARVQGKDVPSRYEIELVGKDGRMIPIEINAAEFDYEGRPASLAMVRDITKFKEMDKLKSEFISLVSHQLNTPLAGIRWLTELLLKQKDLDPAVRESVQEIAKVDERAILLVDDLLSISRLETSEKYKVVLTTQSIRPAINDALDAQKIFAQQKQIVLHVCQSCEDDFVLFIDRGKIAEAFNNLLNNAIKYSPPGRSVEFCCRKEKDCVVFWVRDEGYGIPKAQQNHVYDRFFRADNVAKKAEGTGLGLPIVKTIVEQHHGKTWFESEEGKGSTFYISLPLS